MSYLMGDNPDAQQYHNHSYSHLPTPPASSYAAEPVVLPKVGQTRCYWALLSSDLQFIYLDPVLNYHLGEQAELLVGKSLLSFVHPDEQASAKRDLGSVLESKTLHGSVTRVRYSRLSSVRRQLGYQGPGPDWVDADKVSLDRDYLAVDLVINWAADGLVLCFIHAIVDLNSIADNDEVHKTDWTNWCGTPWMPPEQIDTLHDRSLMCVPQTGTMSRVFQILLNERERPLLLSWPPDSTQGPSSGDFAKLVENVQISTGVPGGSDAKTSCTRRYKALQDMPSVPGCQVESIFIPHGTIIFACHKVNSTPPRTSTAMNQVDYAHYSHYYDQPTPYNMPPLPAHDVAYSNGFPHNTYSPHRWQPALTQNIHNLRSEYPAASPPAWSSASPSASSTSTTYLPSGPPTAAQAPFDRSLSPPPSYNTGYAPMPSGANCSSSTVPVSAATGSDVVPPSRRRVSPTSARDRDPSTSYGHGPGSGPGPIRGSTASGATGIGVSKPSGILKCSSCKTTQSPEWRKGPSGKKELCNACGLRYARSRAKKEGPQMAPSRRRKVDLAKRESATPPTSNTPYPPSTATGLVRRNVTDTAPSASPSGDIYAAPPHHRHHHPHHHVLDNHLTPSPSPPASAGIVTATGVPNVGYVHYATASGHAGHGHEMNNRPHPSYSSISNTFYSTPSPLSGIQHVAQQQHQNHTPREPTPSPTVSSSHHQQLYSHPHSRQHHPQPQQHHANTHTQLPPLEQIKAAIPSPMPPAYEQERELRGQQQQHVPLTPLSAGEPRDGYRKAM